MAKERGLLQGKSVEELKALKKNWQGEETTTGKGANKKTVRLNAEAKPGFALESAGIGHPVAKNEPAPGDIIQFWRQKNGSGVIKGHSAIFRGWLWADDDPLHQRTPIGVRYRSTQGSTEGVGDSVETIGSGKGQVNWERVYFGRLNQQAPPGETVRRTPAT